MKIVFVCTGNTCRSPMAAALMSKHMCECEVFSAGVAVFGSAPASRHAIEVMKQEGLDISSHMSSGVSHELVSDAGLVLAMTNGHKESLLCHYPDCAHKIFTLGEYAGVGHDVMDPFGMGLDEYRKCADMIAEMIALVSSKL